MPGSAIGDLILVDPSQMITALKGSIMSAVSIHLKFDYDESVFRWIWRQDSLVRGNLAAHSVQHEHLADLFLGRGIRQCEPSGLPSFHITRNS